MDIQKREVLRYMGCHESIDDEITMRSIDECIDEAKGLASQGVTFGIFGIKKANGGIEIENSGIILRGESIAAHLEGCEKCAIMAATLGSELDMRIRYYSKASLSKGIILDACGAAGVESLCDIAEESIKEIAQNEGYSTTFRYSPGYGDLPLGVQPGILRLLDAQKKIGLTATDSLILIPRKSVTAVIGFSKKKTHSRLTCGICSMNGKCSYQKRGKSCGS